VPRYNDFNYVLLKLSVLCLLLRPRRRWEDDIKIDLQEIGWGVMDWIELV